MQSLRAALVVYPLLATGGVWAHSYQQPSIDQSAAAVNQLKSSTAADHEALLRAVARIGVLEKTLETLKTDSANLSDLQKTVQRALQQQLDTLTERVARLENSNPPPPPLPVPDPTLTLSANPVEIETGKSAKLDWRATDVEACTAFKGWQGDRQKEGTETVSPAQDTDYGLDCQSSSGLHTQKSVSVKVKQPLPPPPPPPPPPAPVPSPRADNTIRLTNISGTTAEKYPLQFGRPFMQGEIPRCPQVVGSPPAAAQAVVKNRWPDDSVKFAVFNAVIDLPTTSTVTLQFTDQACPATEQAPTADLLTKFPDFDATFQLTLADGTVQTVSARDMLEKGYCAPWTTGPLAVSLTCADRSTARVYDRGSAAWRSFHPEFGLTFWLGTGQVDVRYVGEISNSNALEAITYNLALSLGKDNPVTVYTQAGIKHSIGTRWTRRALFGPAREIKVNIDHNIGYLADTRLIPNYDRSLHIPESVTAGAYAGWLTTDRKIGGAGYWTKNMPNTGYHPDIGPMPLWHNRVLMSAGDWRNWEVMLGQADLAGAWPMQVRQGDPTKFADRAKTVPALGLTLTVYSNPSLWLFDTRATPAAADALKPSGNVDPYSFSAWSRDGAHQPDPFTVPYLLTGDYFYLEGLKFWAGANSLNTNPGTGYIGRSGPYAFIYDQTRGEAWTLRTLTNAAVLTPDADPLHGVFAAMMDDVLARWEGKYGINGTAYQNTPTWNIGRQYLGTIYDGFRGLGPSPLGWWSWDGYGPAQMNPAYFDMTVAATGQAPWMQDFMILALARADEMGFSTRKLLEFAGKHVIGRLIDPGYNPYLIGEYIIPDTKVDGKWLATWAETLTGWTPKFRALNVIEGYWPTVGQEIYWDVARGATGAVADKLPGGKDAWDKFGEIIAGTIQRTGKAPDWNLDPTWAVVPRVPD